MRIKKQNYIILIIILLIFYIYFILSKTLLFRHSFEGTHLRLDLFWSYKVLNKQWLQIAQNILLFIPFGILLSLLIKKKWIVFIIGFCFSCLIEYLQFYLKIGLCELDDIFHNSLGLFIGILAVLLFKKISLSSKS